MEALRTYAKLISLATGYTWMPIILGLILFNAGLSQGQLWFFGAVFVLLDCAVPFGYLRHLLKKGVVRTIDLTYREERIKVLVLALCMHTVTLGLTLLLGTERLFHLYLSYYMVFSLFSFVTSFWKISYHMTINTYAILLLQVLVERDVRYLFLILPVVYWARFVLQKHTHAQLIAGGVMTGLMAWGVFRWSG